MNQHSIIKALLSLVLILPGLALGAVHPIVLAFFMILGAGLLVCIASPHARDKKLQTDLPSLLFLVLIGFTGLQIIPLPSAIVSFISPTAYELRASALGPFGIDPPSFMPLSLDITFTIGELGKLCLYLAVYWGALLCTNRYGSNFVLGAVVMAGALAAFVLLAHKILMLESIYGFYEPLHVGHRGERISAPLINENHMAALLGLSSAVAIGWAIATRDKTKRILNILIAALIGGSLLLTLSRGGIAAFVAGQILFVLLRILDRFRGHDNENDKHHLAWIPLGLALSLGLGFFAAQDTIINEFLFNDHKKIELLGQGLPLVEKFFATGVGRGAFWVAFPLVSDWAATTTFTHAENAILQLLVDYGALFGSLVLLGFGAIVARLMLTPPRNVKNTAALVAIVAFGIHNLVDFNMEIPGVAVLAVALLGVLFAPRKKATRCPQFLSFNINKSLVYGLVVLTVIIAGLTGFYSGRYNLDREERELHSVVGKVGDKKFKERDLSLMISRHPTNWYLPFLVGAHKFHTGDKDSLPWLARALTLNPSSAAAHLYVGRVLLRAGYLDQAMIEFRLASRKKAKLSSFIARLLINKEQRFEKLHRIASNDDDKRLLWSALALELSRRNLDEAAQEIDLALIALTPAEPRSIARQAQRKSKSGYPERALALTDQLSIFPDFKFSGAMLKAEILQRDKRPAEAVEVLQAAVSNLGEDTQLLRRLAWALQKNGDHAGAIKIVGQIMSKSTDVPSRISAIMLKAKIELASGKTQATLASYRQAHALDPRNINILKGIATLAEKHGDNSRAVNALNKLISLDPSNKEWSHKLTQIENKLRLKSVIQ